MDATRRGGSVSRHEDLDSAFARLNISNTMNNSVEIRSHAPRVHVNGSDGHVVGLSSSEFSFNGYHYNHVPASLYGYQEPRNRYFYTRNDDQDTDFAVSNGSRDNVHCVNSVPRVSGPLEPVVTNQNGFSGVGPSGSGNGFTLPRYQNSVRNSNDLYNSNSNNNNSVLPGQSSNWRRQVRVPDSPVWSIFDWRVDVVSLAKDQYGCRLLQSVMTVVDSRDQIDTIFLKLIDHVVDLMVDPFGNYVVQKLIDICNDEQRTLILFKIAQIGYRLVNICLNVHGSRSVQKLLSYVTNRQEVLIFMSALSPGAVALAKDHNGHHVVQFCLKYFPADDNKYLVHVIADNCFGVATDKNGCCLIQQCVNYAQGETRDYLVSEIASNAQLLAQSEFGNYVVQHILAMKIPQYTTNLLAHLGGSYMTLSCNKYASNVVERCLEFSSEEQAAGIIVELLECPDFPMLLVDAFGNFVVQRALSVSKGLLHDALLHQIQLNIATMRNNMFSKKLLAFVEGGRSRHRTN